MKLIIDANGAKLEGDSGRTIALPDGGRLQVWGDVTDLNSLDGAFVAVSQGGALGTAVFADPLGRREVFYAKSGAKTIVATDPEAIAKELGSLHYSQTSLMNLLTVYGYGAPKRETIYKEISRLGVGEKLCVDAGGHVTFQTTPFKPVPTRAYGEADHDRYADLLEEAVRCRGSESGNWVFLSSGWDSTTLLALLVKLYGASKVRGVIGQMNYSDRAGTINQFEIDRARKFADYYGVRLDVVPFDLHTPESVGYWDGLAPELRSRHIYAISAYNFARLSDHILENGGSDDAIFAGEISDGAHNLGFAQYATILDHPDLGFREYADKMAAYLFGPSFFKRVLADDYRDDAVYHFFKSRLDGSRFDDGKGLSEPLRRLKYLASFFLRNTRVPFYSLQNSKMLTPRGAECFESEIAETYLREGAARATPGTLYAWLLHLYNSFYWAGSTVRAYGARLSARGRTLQLPYWDSRLQEFLSAMPEDWGRGLELRPVKYPLKEMLRRRTNYPLHFQTGPHSYLYDVNPRFSHVSELLYGSCLVPRIKQALKGYPYERLLDGECFDLGYLKSCVDGYLSGREATGQERSDLMALATLSLVGWY